jgi:hypothetical protein
MDRKPLKDFVLAVDFDGTITHDPVGYPACGEPNTEVIEAVKMLYDFGIHIVIWTLRDYEGSKEQCIEFLDKHDIKYDEYCDACKFDVDFWGGINPRKVSADLYWDDRNVGGLASAKDTVKDVIIRYGERVRKYGDQRLPNQEIDGDFIDAYVSKYLTGSKTTLRRTKREEDEN